MRAAPAALLAVVAVVSTGVDHGDAATATDPIFVFSPVPEPSPAPPIPPPEGYLNGPCGLAVDAAGNFYVADYNHDVVDVYDGEEDYTPPPEPVYGSRGYLGQLKVPDPLGGPCGLALGNGGELYVNSYHRAVQKYGPYAPSPSPSFSPGPVLTGAGVDSAHPTGVAVDPATGNVYVDERTYVGVYEPSGDPVEVGGLPLRIGVGSLDDGYGVGVSGYPGTAGYVYVPDAASDTVRSMTPPRT